MTTVGVLNDTITEGVVSTPSDPGKDFVYGDWGPVEAEWRRTAEHKIATPADWQPGDDVIIVTKVTDCLLYTSPSPRD